MEEFSLEKESLSCDLRLLGKVERDLRRKKNIKYSYDDVDIARQSRLRYPLQLETILFDSQQIKPQSISDSFTTTFIYIMILHKGNANSTSHN